MTVWTIELPKEPKPDKGTTCSHRMTIGKMKTLNGVVHYPKRQRCPDQATRFINDKPYCAVHQPKARKRPG